MKKNINLTNLKEIDKQASKNNTQNQSNENSKLQVFKRRNFYTLKDSGIVYILALIFPLVLGLFFAYISVFIATSMGIEFAEGTNIIYELFDNYLWFSIPYMLLTQIVFLSIWLIYHPSAKISYSASKISFKHANYKTILISILIGIICVLGFIWLIEGCFGRLFSMIKPDYYSPELPLYNVGWLFLNLLILGIIPAICEELLFRGIIFGGLRKNYPAWISVLLTGLLFALMHQNILQFIYPFILGCVLSIVMEKTGNLLYPILIHAFNNFTTIIISYIFITCKVDAKSVFNVQWWGILLAIVLAIVTCLILWLIYRFYLSRHKKLGEEDSLITIKTNENNLKAIEKDKNSNTISQPIMVGKISLNLIIGILLAIIMIVINLIG